MLSNKRTLLSLVLVAAGAVLLFLGARDFLDSILGQREAARQWEADRDSPKPAQPAPPDLGPALARLSIPRLESSWFVFEGLGKKELRLGPGHMPGTAIPGTRGNAVIAGHRDTHFRVLKDIRKGDELLVETRDGHFRYEVTDISIVKPSNTKSLQNTHDAVMNLITCYPFYYVGPAPMRFVVQARLAGEQSSATSSTRDRRPS